MLFELKSVYNYKTYVKYDRLKSPCENENVTSTTVFMCIEKKVFLNLCDLYPKTANNLKFRGLERREAILEQFTVSNRLVRTLASDKVGAQSNINKLFKMAEKEKLEKPEPVEMPVLATRKQIDINKVEFLAKELNEDEIDDAAEKINDVCMDLNAQVN